MINYVFKNPDDMKFGTPSRTLCNVVTECFLPCREKEVVCVQLLKIDRTLYEFLLFDNFLPRYLYLTLMQRHAFSR